MEAKIATKDVLMVLEVTEDVKNLSNTIKYSKEKHKN